MGCEKSNLINNAFAADLSSRGEIYAMQECIHKS